MKRSDIQQAVKEPVWQTFRLSLRGLPTGEKLRKLKEYRKKHKGYFRQVQVENYINALKRAGLL